MNREQLDFALRGAMTALVTPFRADGRIDTGALQALVERQVEAGIHALVPAGTTGEGATLTDPEHAELIARVAEFAGGRVPVIAGCGSNDTRRTVAAARRAADAGAQGLLVVTPYYNKPNPTGLIGHFETVARATALPVVLYNVPGRTGQNLPAELTLRLARIPGVMAIKEASGNLDQVGTILAERPSGFRVLCGDDSLTLPMMALGADGVISVVSNEAPRAMRELVDAVAEGDLTRGRELHFRLLPLMRANFVESNPVPVKAALALLGLCEPHVRLPLGPADESTRRVVEAALRSVQSEVPAR